MSRDWEEAKRELFDDDPELERAYEAGKPAYIVSREILRARADLGISQAELARRMGSAQSVVSRLENMEGSPNMRTVFALAKALGREVELRFVDPAAQDEALKTFLANAPEWVRGSREEFVEGFVALVSSHVADMTDAVRHVLEIAADEEQEELPEALAR